ncbi:APC family permease [Vampirovibrio sp.]|uniref:APC family permease n=1 Tax=Vampirovibrio sp. TaxID=2717857 RepID=UPI0035940D10
MGNPLASHRERHERLSVPIGLAVFASDALSSTAYATEEILIALFASGLSIQMGMTLIQASAFNGILALPIAAIIIILMFVVVMSYREVIMAHPNGGGSYEVAKTRLGRTASQIAGSALLIDYVLTVSVSISSGVANIVSTGWFPKGHNIAFSVVMIMIIMLLNLRGLKESGKAFAVPAFFFIISMVAMIGTGIFKVMTGQVESVPEIAVVGQQVSTIAPLVLIAVLLRAFSHGCAALTGIEAVSNGVQAFKEPAEVNASRTMVYMGLVLAVIFLGVTYLAYALPGIVPPELDPHHETVISQIAASVFSHGSIFYLTVQFVTAIILILAANTSFNGFPRLGMILAQDGYLPRQLMNLGDRLVYSNGIVILSFFAMLLIIIYKADYNAMIPLYAIGVFLSFTLAQWGMIRHHKAEQKPGWQRRATINMIGAVLTGVVTIILAVEKFTEGAWIVLVAMPIIIFVFRQICHHYESIGKQLALPEDGYCPLAIEHTVLVLISSLHRGTIPALEYAKTISDRVEAVHVELNPAGTERVKRAWEDWGCGIPLTILKSPYRSISEPLLEYIDEVEDRYEHDLVTIIVPEFVTKSWWHNLLHNQTSIMIKTLLRYRSNKVVTTVRYHLDE